jgi:hypothetical protein
MLQSAIATAETLKMTFVLCFYLHRDRLPKQLKQLFSCQYTVILLQRIKDFDTMINLISIKRICMYLVRCRCITSGEGS